eukprot:366371-Chlamydomonas_euryale.AAC.18
MGSSRLASTMFPTRLKHIDARHHLIKAIWPRKIPLFCVLIQRRTLQNIQTCAMAGMDATQANWHRFSSGVLKRTFINALLQQVYPDGSHRPWGTALPVQACHVQQDRQLSCNRAPSMDPESQPHWASIGHLPFLATPRGGTACGIIPIDARSALEACLVCRHHNAKATCVVLAAVARQQRLCDARLVVIGGGNRARSDARCGAEPMLQVLCRPTVAAARGCSNARWRHRQRLEPLSLVQHLHWHHPAPQAQRRRDRAAGRKDQQRHCAARQAAAHASQLLGGFQRRRRRKRQRRHAPRALGNACGRTACSFEFRTSGMGSSWMERPGAECV